MGRVPLGSTEGRCKLNVGLPMTLKAAREVRSFLSPGKLAETPFTKQLSLPHFFADTFLPCSLSQALGGQGRLRMGTVYEEVMVLQRNAPGR